jgi:hypothetical protein
VIAAARSGVIVVGVAREIPPPEVITEYEIATLASPSARRSTRSDPARVE